uniref:DH domain-containing protein n=2 Tax=Schistocephalus solidus TaxID=70667 RepID=A0A0X3PQS3_SCHSO
MMTYYVPYEQSEGGQLRNDRLTDSNERLISRVTKYQVANSFARNDRENEGLREWSEKQVAGDHRKGCVSNLEIKNGLDTINSQISCLVQSVARLEHSNQLLWEKFGLLEKPPGTAISVQTRGQRSPLCTPSPSESPQSRTGRNTDASPTLVHPDCPLHGREKERLSPRAADNVPFVRVACSANSPVPPIIYIGKASSGEVRVTEADVFAPRASSRWHSKTEIPSNLPHATVMSEVIPAETAEHRFRIEHDGEVCSSSDQTSPVVRTSNYAALPIAPPPSTVKRDNACSPIHCGLNSGKRSVSVGTSDVDKVASKPPTPARDPPQQPSGQEGIAKRLPMIVDSIEAHRIRLKHNKSPKAPETGFRSRTNDKEQTFKVPKSNMTTSGSTSSGENLPPALVPHPSTVSKRLSKSQEAFSARPIKRQLWNIQPISANSSRSSADSGGGGGSNSNDTSPIGTPKVSPGARPPCSNTSRYPRTTAPTKSFQNNRNANEETKQPDFIAMVLEELATTEQTYVHTLSQFLILRDEVFAPNWKINRQKFIRLFPAAIDDLYNLHRVASGKMKLALDKSETSQSRSRSISCDRSERSMCPFRVLADMIDGCQTLGYASHTRFASYYHGVPAWSVAPFFRLYMRYLSEFSLAMQALSEMRHGSSTLKRNLKKLQRHPACELRDITAYLLAPVQRLPRYLLLVKKLIYYTSKNEQSALYRCKAGLRKCEYGPDNSAIVGPSCPIPTHPSLEALRRAESALHGMLLELDEMVGVEMAGLCGRKKAYRQQWYFDTWWRWRKR